MSDASCFMIAGRPLEGAGGVLVTLQGPIFPPPHPSVLLRAGRPADVAELEALERRAFTHDRIARRSFVRFLASPGASLVVAEGDGALCGYALVLFRARSPLARLYSIAVDVKHAGRQIGSRLLRAAEDAARQRGSKAMRLEVREDNMSARNLYRVSGFRFIGRLAAYCPDGSDALRLQKLLKR
jgi:ribosomal protein S18 acetylase RimI-like enzyme